jgi:hypothetical protein
MNNFFSRDQLRGLITQPSKFGRVFHGTTLGFWQVIQGAL